MRTIFNWLFVAIAISIITPGCGRKGENKLSPVEPAPAYLGPTIIALDSLPPPVSIDLSLFPPQRIIPKGEDKGTHTANAIDPIAHFTNFTTADGLPANMTYHVMGDQGGQIWVSTGIDICRYQASSFGPDFQVFKLGTGSPIYQFIEDSKGNFWFSCWGAGMLKFDGVRLTMLNESNGLVHNLVTRCGETRDGKLWINTFGGISLYDGKKFTNYTMKDGLASDKVNSSCEDKNGTMWFATAAGINSFDGKTFKTYRPKGPDSLAWFLDVKEDENGLIWAASSGGVYYFDPQSHDTVLKRFDFGQMLTSENTNSIFIDRRGIFWMAMYGSGVCRFDPGKFNFQTQKDLNDSLPSRVFYTTEQGLANNKVLGATEDQQGNIWISTEGGISRFNGEGFQIYSQKQGLPKTTPASIFEDKSKTIWVGPLQSGLYKFSGERFYKFKVAPSLDEDHFNCITQDSKENLWFGANGGCYQYDGKEFKRYTSAQGLAQEGTNEIIEDSKGNIWIATHNGIARYDGKFMTSYTPKQGISDDYATDILEDEEGKLWISTENGGINRFDGKTIEIYTTKQGLAHNTVKSAVRDQSGFLWFGTAGGISRFDGKGFLNFTVRDGLPDNMVWAVAEGNDGVIWAGTEKGVAGLRFKNGGGSGETIPAGRLIKENSILQELEPVWELYNNSTGYPVRNLFERALFISKEGDLWCGDTDEKLIKIRPATIRKNRQNKGVARPIIYSVQINETLLNWYSLTAHSADSALIAQQENLWQGKIFSGLERDQSRKKFGGIKIDSVVPFYNVPVNLKLPIRNNRVTITYGTYETGRPEMIRYQYKLEGYDNDWSGVTDRATVSYGNIQEGKYTFLLKAMNPEGEWSEPIRYSFTVLPPWTRTKLAYTLYTVLFLSLLYGIYRWRTSALRREKRKLEERVHQRTKQLEAKSGELEKSLTELKAAQAQLVQSEKMASLGELTAGIAHEIQNPLNFVNNFSELNQELLEDLGKELESGHTDSAREIAADIKDNSAKISHHGQRASGIVKGMLQHSRSSSGQKEPTDINALSDEYLRLAYHGLRAKDKTFNATIKTDFDESIGKISIIPQDIGRVILNLINNAFYAVTERRALSEAEVSRSAVSEQEKLTASSQQLTAGSYESTILVSTKRTANNVEIQVADNGNGIPQKILDKIFQPFFTTKPTGQGTGLGLSLSYDIVKAHGGEIRVETKEGEGTAFIISLPL